MKRYLILLALLPSCGKEKSPAPAAAEKPAAPAQVPGLERKEGMVKLAGGSYKMGHDGPFDTPYGRKEFPEEAPAHEVSVKPFWVDETEVTNAQFAEFVKATNYITFAERVVKAEDFPPEARANLPPGDLANGAIVFREDAHVEGNPNEAGRALEWWRWDPKANWRHPAGEGTSIEGKESHPVVCVTYEDASAYAKWAGKRLPTEAEWEFAARGGLVDKIYSWGDELKPGGQWMANTWQGEFPNKNTGDDGYTGSAPVKTFAPNGYGLYDMAGNVWEICNDLYDPNYFTQCDPDNPQGPAQWVNRDTGLKGDGKIHRVTKGGSFLCHVSYCMRYRPAARHSQDTESPTNHTGFRCVKD
ncbi:formylglycine-generating enzyme family protein [Luteolibacter sp. GHJ8]|uniref:Formylglycine-generating enzyme family protein n=1 Tax=Luteolibacter rhizosphaerae TaxID=2989719 RepID=A0ABT3G6U5_9BACT|nr:formylglycine-generating enzyme family protein [Luteolibacter rhizosphaerae]MCW1915525.1 formylglycine-generating enzyme family protein [Luteolibacter rhizosphaerae]